MSNTTDTTTNDSISTEACVAADCARRDRADMRRGVLAAGRPLQRRTATMAGKGDDDNNGPGKNGPGKGDDDDGRTGIVTKTRPKTKKPSLYKVLLLNDDYTPMEFVVLVLERFFNKGRDDAHRIMLHVHHKGVGICGVYTFEVAETKVTLVTDFARQHQHPLRCTMEKE